jgi:outer membrane immunogenic protein
MTGSRAVRAVTPLAKSASLSPIRMSGNDTTGGEKPKPVRFSPIRRRFWTSTAERASVFLCTESRAKTRDPLVGASMNRRTLSVLLVAALASSALSSIASAADLAPAPRTYTKAPMISPATNWSGFYGGVNIGYGWGNNDMAFGDAPGLAGAAILPQSLKGKSSGVIGGGEIGYNWQVGSLVTGVEADIQGSGIKGTATQSPIATTVALDPGEIASASSHQRLSWFGTARGRLGVTATPDLLLFATGGLAYGQVSTAGNVVDKTEGGDVFDLPGAASRTKTGWAVGAGAEWMFTRGWSAKVEYLHIDLGTASAVGALIRESGTAVFDPAFVAYHWRNSFDTVRAGVNYHFN